MRPVSKDAPSFSVAPLLELLWSNSAEPSQVSTTERDFHLSLVNILILTFMCNAYCLLYSLWTKLELKWSWTKFEYHARHGLKINGQLRELRFFCAIELKIS